MDKTKIAVSIFNKLANVYQDKFMDVSMYHYSFDVFCNHIINKDADVLELACGPGNITQYLLKIRPNFKILGTDLAPNMIELARINNPTAEFKILDCRNMSVLNKQFDAIMCGFCLPYLSKEDAIALIKEAHLNLKPQGVLYISTMEDDYNKSGLKKGSSGDEMFMHYHQEDYLLSAAKENGFKVIDISRKQYSSADGEITTDLIIILCK